MMNREMNKAQPFFQANFLAQTTQRLIGSKIAFASIASAEFIIEEASNNFASILRANPADPLVNQLLSDILYELAGMESYIYDVLSADELGVYHLERVNRQLPNGETIYLDYTLTQQDEYPSNFLLMVEDTTEFGRLEQSIIQERNELRLAKQQLATSNAELRKLAHLKSLFFSMAAHDLRAPIMVIRGYSELLASMLNRDQLDMLSENNRDALEFIETVGVQSNWLDNIIHNILDLNQIENNRLRLDKTRCDINSLLDETVKMIEPMAKLNQQQLTAELPDELYFIDGDPQRIQQIMQNLIGNAIKYTPPMGQVCVKLSASAEEVCVAVSDTGRGMPPNQLSDIFDLYYRTDSARESSIKGTGLGLYIVSTLVKAHGGKIQATSELGKGSTFTFWLPRA